MPSMDFTIADFNSNIVNLKFPNDLHYHKFSSRVFSHISTGHLTTPFHYFELFIDRFAVAAIVSPNVGNKVEG